MSVALGTGILYPAFRIAGITKRPMRVPSPDQSSEAIGILNRMIGTWNCSPLDIFTYLISLYPLNPNKLSYQFGAGAADFPLAAAPQAISEANIILPGVPPLRQPLSITDKAGWASIRLQLIPGGIPIAIYPDFNFPITTIYLYPQPPSGYQLELYTPQLVPVFVAVTDTVTLPPGYEAALVDNLALAIAAAYPEESALQAGTPARAANSLAAIESRNAPVPRLHNDAAGLNGNKRNGEGWNWWRTGGYGQ